MDESTLVSYLQRIEAALEALNAAQNRLGSPGKGWTDPPGIIYVGRQHGGLLFNWNHRERRATLSPTNCFQLTLRRLELYFKEASDEWEESWKLRIHGVTENGYQVIQCGATTAFARGIVEPVLHMSEDQLRNPVYIVAVPSQKKDTVVLCNLFDYTGEQLFLEEDERAEGKWRKIWETYTNQAIAKLAALHGAIEPSSAPASAPAPTTTQPPSRPQNRPPAPPQSRPVAQSAGMSTAIAQAAAPAAPVNLEDNPNSGMWDRFRRVLANAKDLGQIYAAEQGLRAPENWQHICDLPGIESLIEAEVNRAKARVTAQIGSPTLDLSEPIAKTTIELKRLRWTQDQGRAYLEQTYGVRSRQHLNDEQLIEFLGYLQKQPTPVAEPA